RGSTVGVSRMAWRVSRYASKYRQYARAPSPKACTKTWTSGTITSTPRTERAASVRPQRTIQGSFRDTEARRPGDSETRGWSWVFFLGDAAIGSSKAISAISVSPCLRVSLSFSTPAPPLQHVDHCQQGERH